MQRAEEEEEEEKWRTRENTHNFISICLLAGRPEILPAMRLPRGQIPTASVVG
jgi:hypothetical protein